MQGLEQQCDDHSQSDPYGTTLERAQYHGVMRDIVEHMRLLRPATCVEQRVQHAGQYGDVCVISRARTWSYDNASLQLPAEVPQIRIDLSETCRNERQSGYLLSSERLHEHLVLALRVNNDSCKDVFTDQGEKEWSYGLVGERYRQHDVGRWRGYSPEAARIASVVLRCLEHPQEMEKVAADLEHKVA